MSVLDVRDRPAPTDVDDADRTASRRRHEPAGPGQTAPRDRFRWLLEPTPESIITAAGRGCRLRLHLRPAAAVQPVRPHHPGGRGHGRPRLAARLPAGPSPHPLPPDRLGADWYAGFPSLVFYFPLPTFAIVVLNVILPYRSRSSWSACPAWSPSRWRRGRSAGCPGCPSPARRAWPRPPCRSSSAGSSRSTAATSPRPWPASSRFSISLAPALIFLGLVARGLDTGRYRAWAVVALAVTGLCHLLPTVFAVGRRLRPDLSYGATCAAGGGRRPSWRSPPAWVPSGRCRSCSGCRMPPTWATRRSPTTARTSSRTT